MKILICLTTIISACSGGILNGYNGNSLQEIEIEPQQLQHVHQEQFVEQGHFNAPEPQHQQLQIVKIQSVGNGGGFGNGDQSGWQPISNIDSHQSQPQIIKVIHEHSSSSHGRHGGQQQPQIIKIIEEQSISGSHGNNEHDALPHQIIRVIEEESHGGHGGNPYGSNFGGHDGPNFGGHNGPNFGGHGSPSQSEPQIIFSDPPSVPLRPSTGDSSKSSQSSNPLSSLTSIIPRFFRMLFGGGDSQQKSLPSLPSIGGRRPINTPNAGQLINTYGYGGTTKINRGGKLLNSFYKSGRVIESGTLKIASVKSH